MQRRIAVLGSTGSIGKNALRVIEAMKGEFIIHSLTAHTDAAALTEQAHRYKPAFVGLTGRKADMTLPAGVKAGFGAEALIEAAAGADMVVLAVVGIAGLPVFEYCLKNGITVALATKEAMVCGGRIARTLMDETKTTVLPLDSELSAIFQCMEGRARGDIKRLLLTASGGPFLNKTREEVENATADEALRHPNWSMGRKITIDCATMINKGLEVMETRWLFDIPSERIDVIVHPESIIHSMVELTDNTVMAQLGVHDMRLPIEVAFAYPKRVDVGVAGLELTKLGKMTFFEPDTVKFPCLGLCYEALSGDSTLQLVINSANEVAVAAFLDGKIPFGGIPKLIESAMRHFGDVRIESFSDIYGVDKEVRRFCELEHSGV